MVSHARFISLRTRLTASLVLLLAVMLGVLAYVLDRQNVRLVRQQTQAREELFARNVQQSINQVLFAGKYQAQAYLETLAEGAKDICYVRIIERATGRVIASTDPAEVGRRFEDPVTRRALATLDRDGLLLQDVTDEHGRRCNDLALPYVRGYLKQAEGIIRVGISQETEQRQIAQVRFLTLSLILLFLALGTILAITLGYQLTFKLKQLVRATHRFGAGQYDAKVAVPADPRDELELLGLAFNQMAARLRASAENLEGQVRERTEELARLNQDLRASYEKLQELDKLKSTFVSAVSHDLRTPLTSIKGYAEFLEDEVGGPLSPHQMEFVLQIERGAERLENLVDDLLDFARIEAGTFSLRLVKADLASEIRELTESLRPQLQEAHLDIRLQLPADPLLVRMDPERISRVLMNLLNNAIKFTPAGGWIRVQACDEGEAVRCEVTDSGPGIAFDDLPKLFQRFSQLPFGMHKGGTGLGLSISKSIIEAHGGTIGVTSEQGVGSTFWFTLAKEPPNVSQGDGAPGI
ncbi:HAMP domain-containing protein [bacterium]|nr:HAMP domain-containing protein [bacterium]